MLKFSDFSISLLKKIYGVKKISVYRQKYRRIDGRTDNRPTDRQGDSNKPPKLCRAINIQPHPSFYLTNKTKLYVSSFSFLQKNPKRYISLVS